MQTDILGYLIAIFVAGLGIYGYYEKCKQSKNISNENLLISCGENGFFFSPYSIRLRTASVPSVIAGVIFGVLLGNFTYFFSL